MKNILSVLFALLMSCITASAQIQNGYVRSQGTSYNRTGSPLKGARVFVKGLNGAKVTAPNGTFYFNLGGGKTQFSISSVTLKGYTLLSPLAPAYNVGKIAVEIVMQSREERIQNETRISKVIEERITKSYNAKTRELQKKITSLEKALSDKKKNSDELETQIRSLKEQLGNLDNQYLKRNELIDKMVEEYVNLDYATMNNRKAELCSYIETGELEKADSLLNTIDINKEMNDIKTINRDIEEKESMLAKEKEIRKNKIETACMYWRGKYDIAIQNMQYDSAAVYVKNLADVDTCNFYNVYECAKFFQKQNCFKEAEEYYIKILKKMEQESNSTKNIRIDNLYNNLAVLYSGTQRFKECEDMHKAVITIRERLAKENPATYEPDLASSYNNLATLYDDIQRLEESEKMHKAAIEIRERLVKENPKAYEPYLAMSYNNLAALYNKIQRFDESEKMNKAAIEMQERLAKENPKAYEPELAMSYNNLAILYNEIQRHDESEKMYKAAIEIQERLVKENPTVYEPDLVSLYDDLAFVYYETEQFKESEKTYKKAISIYEQLYENNPQEYQKVLALNCYLLATIMIKNNKNHDAIVQFERSLKFCNNINKDEFDMSLYTSSLCYLVDLYSNEKNYTKAYSYNEVLIPLLKVNYEENAQRWKTEYNNKALNQSFYANLLGKFKEGEQYSLEAIKVDSTKHIAYTNLAAALLFQGKVIEAEKLYLEYKDEFKNTFIDDFAEFERLGVIPVERKADVERIKAILNE